MYQSAMANIDECHEELFNTHFPLHAACKQGNVEIVNKVLREIREPDIYQEDGFRAWTPIHWAAFGGHVRRALI